MIFMFLKSFKKSCILQTFRMSMDNVSNEKKMCKGYNFSFTKLNIFNSFYKHTFYDWGFCYGRRKE